MLALCQLRTNHVGAATLQLTFITTAGIRISNAESVRKRDMPIGIADKGKPHEDAPSRHQENLVEAVKEANPRGEALEAKVIIRPNPSQEARVPVELEKGPQA